MYKKLLLTINYINELKIRLIKLINFQSVHTNYPEFPDQKQTTVRSQKRCATIYRYLR